MISSRNSDCSSTLEPGHPFAAVIGDLKNILVDRYLSECSSGPDEQAVFSWPPRKLTRPACSNAYMDVESASDAQDTEAVLILCSDARTNTFACPFFLMNKARYEECLTRHDLPTIEEVKDHLWASHRRPNFCPICKDTFITMKARNDHIRERNCKHEEGPKFEGLTDGQIQQLESLGETTSSRETQWFEVWDIVSPSASPAGPRPLSPYYSTKKELRIVALRHFWETNGQTIISDLLREKGLQGWEVPDEERSLDIVYRLVLQDGIDDMFVKFSG